MSMFDELIPGRNHRPIPLYAIGEQVAVEVEPDWHDQAACREVDRPGELFFPFPGDNVTAARAKAVCARCPVIDKCLAEHLTEQYGIFGGTTPKERQKLRGNRRKPPPEHGTRSMYVAGCICNACRTANAEQRKAGA